MLRNDSVKMQILSKEKREKIAQAGKQILNDLGVRICSPTVYNLLVDAGAVPDKTRSDILRFPSGMVDKYLAMCPNHFTITDRAGNVSNIASGSPPLYYTSNAVTYQRGSTRTVCDIGKQDLTDFVQVVNQLENIHGVVGTSIKEYPPTARDFAGFALMAQYTYKHLRPCIYTPAGAEAIIEMADVILMGKPLREHMFFTLGYSIVSPLTWSETALSLFEKTKGHGIPIMINSEPMAGGTSPVTMAGSLVQADAEVISGIVINQVLEPGRPCVYNAGFAHVMDMMTMIVLTGAPENALLQAAGAEMAAHHGLPCASWALSDAPMMDLQSSYEKLFTLLSHTLSNVNMIWGVGNIETSKTISPEIAVIDNEMIGSCLRFTRGIEVDAKHLALDVILEAGFEGNYLETEHTLTHYQKEIRHSRLTNRLNRAQWEGKGSKSMEDKAKETVDNILRQKPECYLSGAQIDKLENIKKKRMYK